MRKLGGGGGGGGVGTCDKFDFVENKKKKSGDMQMQKLFELKQDIIL